MDVIGWMWYYNNLSHMDVQCGAVIMQSIFSHEDEVLGIFCEFNLLLSSVPIAAVWYMIKSYIGLLYNGIPL